MINSLADLVATVNEKVLFTATICCTLPVSQ